MTLQEINLYSRPIWNTQKWSSICEEEDWDGPWPLQYIFPKFIDDYLSLILLAKLWELNSLESFQKSILVNPFQTNVFFLYPQKTSENERFSDIIFFLGGGGRKEMLAWNVLINALYKLNVAFLFSPTIGFFIFWLILYDALLSILLYVMFCLILYHWYNLKNVKNTHGGMLLLVKLQALKPATLLKITLFHGYFSRFLNCTNGIKSRNASHITSCEVYYMNI